jgi:anti-sigma B factor antagonist
MDLIFDIIKLSPMNTERLNYNTLVFRIELPRKVDVDNAKDLWIYFSTLIAGGALKIYLDLKKLEYIDSSGIGVIINTAKMIRKNNGDIALGNLSDEIRDIFKVISLENFIKIYNSEVEAIRSFRYVM